MSKAKDRVVLCPVCRHPAHAGRKCSAMVSVAVPEHVPNLGRVVTLESRHCSCVHGQEADKPC